MRTRAQIVLTAAHGMPTHEIGRMVGCTAGTASKWRVRYARARLAGLDETGNGGAARKYARRTRSAPWRCWISRRRQDIPTGPRRRWRVRWAIAMSNISGGFCEPRRSIYPAESPGAKAPTRIFVAKAADIVGLYMAPPVNAAVLSVDENPSIQALERAKRYLKLPGGRAMIG